MIKQVIVLRKDLKMRRGKMCAQAAHASMKVFLDIGSIKEIDCLKDIPHYDRHLQIPITLEMWLWFTGIYTKICVYVLSEDALLAIHKQAIEAKLPVALIKDVGKTEFHGVPTYTCLAIGPDKSEKIDKITGDLPLL